MFNSKLISTLDGLIYFVELCTFYKNYNPHYDPRNADKIVNYQI